MDSKHKHLEFIQAIISRMANHSFVVKGWAITLVVALFALVAKRPDKEFIMIAFLPIVLFWILDGYFLSRERKFRHLYDEVRKKNEKEIDFSMDVSKFKKRETNWFWSIFSKTILSFYVSLVGCMLIVSYLIK
ncbi:MAG TPA: hypothetical protein ENI51_01045 [Candidatus Atribacteria bacterium]|nr:hypothetical protein [Candidatus Atribacteria bacterium]